VGAEAVRGLSGLEGRRQQTRALRGLSGLEGRRQRQTRAFVLESPRGCDSHVVAVPVADEGYGPPLVVPYCTWEGAEVSEVAQPKTIESGVEP
jgi:hypothetical protein